MGTEEQKQSRRQYSGMVSLTGSSDVILMETHSSDVTIKGTGNLTPRAARTLSTISRITHEEYSGALDLEHEEHSGALDLDHEDHNGPSDLDHDEHSGPSDVDQDEALR